MEYFGRIVGFFIKTYFAAATIKQSSFNLQTATMKKNIATLLLLLVVHCATAQSPATYYPIVFVHGMLGSGDTYTQPIQRFMEQGYSPAQLVTMDWNTVAFGNSKVSLQLDSVINRVLKKTGATQVNLVGHSAGGGLCYGYLKDSSHAAKVAHYVHIGSGQLSKPATVPTMNIYSKDDLVSGGADVAGATNISLSGKDHYEVATCSETFDAMYAFFNSKKANTKLSHKQQPILVSGRAVTFGENKAEANATITIYAIDNKTGKRKTTSLRYETSTDEMGYWGGFTAKAGEYYEMVVLSGDTAKRPVHYYREPFAMSNPVVYLRTLGKQGMTAMLSNALPTSDAQSVLAVFSSSKAVISGRDSLTANELALSAKIYSAAKKTCIAYFLFDNGDGATGGDKLPLFSMIPFMNAVDMMIPANSKPINLYYNGRTMNLPSMPASKGVMVAVFD